MCSTFKFGCCMGRNFDYEQSYKEELRIVEANEEYDSYKVIGMVTGLVKDFPLFYDGMNEYGLCCSALAFEGNAVYNEIKNGMVNVPAYNVVLWVLGKFKSVAELIDGIDDLNITNQQFSEKFPNNDLHWLVADKEQSIIIEQTKFGLRWFEASSMTNNPRYNIMQQHYQTSRIVLRDEPIELEYNTRGRETYGLDGGYTSIERFTRLTWIKEQLTLSGNPFDDVSSSFHLLSSVEQVYGLTHVGDKFEFTIYSVVYDMDNLKVYLKFYDNVSPVEYSLVEG